MPLTDAALRNARPKPRPYRLSDGKGLYFLVQPSGAKWSRFDYRMKQPDGSVLRKTLSFGTYPEVSLSDARRRRDDARAMVAGGVDPSESRRAQVEAPPDHSFERVGRDWFKARCPAWSPGYQERVFNRLKFDVFPHIGQMAIQDVSFADVLAVLRGIEARGVGETVYRVKGYISDIFGYGIGQSLVAADPTHLIDAGKLLKDKPAIQNRRALKAAEFPSFFAKLGNSDEEPDTIDALRLVLFTVGRTDEIRFAHKDEFEAMDTDAPLWRLPPSRMKPHGKSGIRYEHLVPLSRQAAAIVRRRLATVGSSGRLFERPTRSGTISENTMLYACYRLGYHSRATVHGFRTSFSTFANEATRIEHGQEVRMWDADWIERCLAHVDPNRVRSTYNAAEYLAGRRALLQWWSDKLDEWERIGSLLG